MGEVATSDTASDSPTRQSEPALRPPGIVDLAAATAVIAVLVAVSMRRSLALTNADSLLYGLISTEELTFYYWGQDRLANLVPAIAWPVQQVEWNHLLQTAILATSFFLLIGGFVWFHATRAGRPTSWPVVIASTAVAGATSLALLSREAVSDFVLVQQYAFSMLLFLVGVWWLTGRTVAGRAVGAIGILAAVLVIPSTVLLAPVATVIRRGPGVWMRTAVVTGVAGAAFVVGTIASRLAYDGETFADAYSDFSLDRLRYGFRRSLRGIVDSVELWPTVMVGAACVVVLLLRRRRFDPTLRWAYAMSPVLAVGWIVLFSANRWIEMNVFLFRYHFTAYAAGLFVISGAAAEIVATIADRRRAGAPWISGDRSRIALLVVPATAIVVVASVAVAANVRVPAIEAGDDRAAVARQFDVELMVGDYWQVWPTVFADRASGGDLLGVTMRSDPLLDRIQVIAESSDTVGVLCTDADPAACVHLLGTFVPGDWRIVSVSSESPLVLEVSAG
jgi:hypothetical protein